MSGPPDCVCRPLLRWPSGEPSSPVSLDACSREAVYPAEGDRIMLSLFARKQKRNGTPKTLARSSVASAVRLLPDVEMRQTKRTSLNRLVDISDWRARSDLASVMRELNEGC